MFKTKSNLKPYFYISLGYFIYLLKPIIFIVHLAVLLEWNSLFFGYNLALLNLIFIIYDLIILRDKNKKLDLSLFFTLENVFYIFFNSFIQILINSGFIYYNPVSIITGLILFRLFDLILKKTDYKIWTKLQICILSVFNLFLLGLGEKIVLYNKHDFLNMFFDFNFFNIFFVFLGFSFYYMKNILENDISYSHYLKDPLNLNINKFFINLIVLLFLTNIFINYPLYSTDSQSLICENYAILDLFMNDYNIIKPKSEFGIGKISTIDYNSNTFISLSTYFTRSDSFNFLIQSPLNTKNNTLLYETSTFKNIGALFFSNLFRKNNIKIYEYDLIFAFSSKDINKIENLKQCINEYIYSVPENITINNVQFYEAITNSEKTSIKVSVKFSERIYTPEEKLYDDVCSDNDKMVFFKFLLNYCFKSKDKSNNTLHDNSYKLNDQVPNNVKRSSIVILSILSFLLHWLENSYIYSLLKKINKKLCKFIKDEKYIIFPLVGYKLAFLVFYSDFFYYSFKVQLKNIIKNKVFSLPELFKGIFSDLSLNTTPYLKSYRPNKNHRSVFLIIILESIFIVYLFYRDCHNYNKKKSELLKEKPL